MTSVVRLAHERGIWVLSDECYVYLNYTGKNFSVGALREYKERLSCWARSRKLMP